MANGLPDIAGYPSLTRALASPEYIQQLEAALPAFLDEHRWFADRGAGPRDIRLRETVRISAGDDLVLAIIAVEGPARVSRYQAPLLASPAGGVVDALDTAPGAELFFDLLFRGDADPRFVVDVPGMAPVHGPARLLAGEQSNTSVVFGESCILKLFRRLDRGRNPDAELTAWLSGAGFAGVPNVLATARVELDGNSADSLVVQSFIANDGDGWSWALSYARTAAEAAVHGTPPEAWLASPDGATLLRGAAALGELTAGLHSALASATGDALEPQPFTREDWDRLVEGVRLDIAAMSSIVAALPEGAPGVLGRLPRCIPPPPPIFGLKTRIHGDYHLGQVLHGERGWTIVDFEGEPARPLAERAALQHPLSDVAGMLRSWDYAAATAAGDARVAWAAATTDAFLGAYRAAAAGKGFLPPSRPMEDALLRLFVLRKALYELRYEMGSRPAWVSIPYGALERLAMEAQ